MQKLSVVSLLLFALSAIHHPLSAQETSIDLSASVEPIYNSWNEISTQTTPTNYSYITQRTTLNLKILERSWILDFRLENLSLFGRDALPREISHLSRRYPQPSPNFFLSHAYFGYSGFVDSLGFNLKGGAIPFQVGKGLLLSDNGLGLMGFDLNIEKIGPLKLELAAGNTKTSSSQEDVTFAFLGVGLSGMGAWQVAFIPEIDKTQRALTAGTTSGNIRRNNTVISYSQNFNHQFLFNMEAVMSQGAYFLNTSPQQKVTTKTSLFALEGGWKAKIPKLERLGPVDFRFVFSQGSGDKAETANDEAFFAPNALRFDGVSRLGWGKYLGATGYDVLGASTTWNSLPAGLSGVSVYGLSFKTKPYKILTLPISFETGYSKFRAAKSTSLSRDLGREWSLGATTQLSERFSTELNFFNFGPGTAYVLDNKKPQSISGLRFLVSLSFL